MGYVLLASGSGGVVSEDVTATKAKVLSGFTTVTNDSDDEIVVGTLPLSGVLVAYGGTITTYNDLS